MTSIERFCSGRRGAPFLRKANQMTAAMATKAMTNVGMSNFFRLKVMVIGFEVRVFLFGMGRSAVGMPFSIFFWIPDRVRDDKNGTLDTPKTL
jgi:hypothetical protein